MTTLAFRTPAGRTAKGDADETLTFVLVAIAAMLFTTFTASYLIRRSAADWAPVRLPAIVWLNTAVLLASSVTAELARRRGAAGRRWLATTGALGLVFAGGQVLAWIGLARSGVFLATSPHASFFYMLTAVHAAHLAGGLVALAVALSRPKARLGPFIVWWHFVDAAWLWVIVMLRFL